MMRALGLAVLLLASASPGASRSIFPQDGIEPSVPADEYEGTGAAQLRLSDLHRVRRDEALARADARTAECLAVLSKVAQAADDKERAAIKRELLTLEAKPLRALEAELTAAVAAERKRMFLVSKALELAHARKASIPGLEPAAAAAHSAWLGSAAPEQAVERRARALRNMAGSLLDYLGDDHLSAMLKMKAATEDGPDLALARVYLGSFLFLVQDTDRAIVEWKKALELDPTNEAVKQALKEYAGAKE